MGEEKRPIMYSDPTTIMYPSRIINWDAKICTSSRALRALIRNLISRGFEIALMYVRIGCNFSREHLSRKDHADLEDRGAKTSMTRVRIPPEWSKLVGNWKPAIDFLNLFCFDAK